MNILDNIEEPFHEIFDEYEVLLESFENDIELANIPKMKPDDIEIIDVALVAWFKSEDVDWNNFAR